MGKSKSQPKILAEEMGIFSLLAIIGTLVGVYEYDKHYFSNRPYMKIKRLSKKQEA